MIIIFNNEIRLPISRFNENYAIEEGGVTTKRFFGRFFYDEEIDTILDNLIQSNIDINSIVILNDMNKKVYENNNHMFIQLKERNVSPSGDFILLQLKMTVNPNEIE